MERLKRLIKKRKEIGKRPSYTKGGDYNITPNHLNIHKDYNDYIEYKRLGDLILEEISMLYDEGKLGG